MPTKPSTFLRVDLNALVYNFQFYKSKLHANTKILAVVKAFGYGHDSVAIAKKLEEEKVDYLAVAFIQEAIQLRKANIKSPILVLHPQKNDIEACVEYNLEPNIYSLKLLASLIDCLKGKSIKNFPIHLKFNTGLNRLGFTEKEIPKILTVISAANQLRIASVFSHLAASEDKQEKAFTRKQIGAYKSIVKALEKELDYPFIKHLTNTSGALNYPEAHFDMVRIGIGLYGYANEEKWTAQLKNVASLQSVISQIHVIEKGESVGYNRAFVASIKTMSATIPIGHADGIPRTWGQGIGYVTINGKKAPILGNVCMDMIMVDVSNIDCNEGDIAVVFDNQQTLEDLALRANTISYELLTAISQRVPRIIVG